MALFWYQMKAHILLITPVKYDMQQMVILTSYKWKCNESSEMVVTTIITINYELSLRFRL